MTENERNILSKIPTPVLTLVRQTEDLFATKWVQHYAPFAIKLLEWTIFYIIGLCGLSYGYLLFIAISYFTRYKDMNDSISATLISKLSSVLKSEQEILGEKIEHFPAWVNFPDFNRVEWINDILAQLWNSIDQYATYFVITFLEPEIKKILDVLQLETVSGFQVKKVDLGSIPLRLGGIKVYNRNTSRDEIIMDTELSYAGDARVLITLQGIQAEIKHIVFKGTARIILKPIIGTLPFVGGFEVCFLNTPTLEYQLGGIGTFAEIAPGASALVKAIVVDQIKSRFVWPNKFQAYLPIEPVLNITEKTYLLSKPSGILSFSLKSAKNLLKKDKTLMNTNGKSDPYAIIKIGEKKFDFRNAYVKNTVEPEWNYSLDVVVSSASHAGQDISIQVFDWDNSSKDDFLGNCTLPLDDYLTSSKDEWKPLQDVKHGEIRIISNWQPIMEEDATSEDPNEYIAQVLIDSGKSLTAAEKRPNPRCWLEFSGHDEETMTQVKPKTSDPVWEESFDFVSRNPSTDILTVEIKDSKNCLGYVKIPMTFVLNQPRKRFHNMTWDLEGTGVNFGSKLCLDIVLLPLRKTT